MKPNSSEIAQAKRIAEMMDSLFVIPGTNWRIGLDPILGLIPGFGDFISNAIGLYPILLGLKYRVSKVIILRMVVNLAGDYVIGSIPILGDLFDALFKANRKNTDLLERGLARPERTQGLSLLFLLFIGAILFFIMVAPLVLLILLLAQLF